MWYSPPTMLPGGLSRLVDADMVLPGLFIGAQPSPGLYRWLHILVLAAAEYQPPAYAFQGVTLVRVPLLDEPDRLMTREEIAAAISGGRTIARYLMAGQRVLSTCISGLNRSSLLAGLAMRLAYDIDPHEVVKMIRAARGPWALFNPNFERLIYRIRVR